ncbi:MAG: threonine synthase [Ignavibacteriales bacterium]|nr:threonine synthase [Ignavibacteriales bacterium]
MQYYSTNNKENKVSFKQAILQGLANDKGLFMPEKISRLPETFFKNLSHLTLQEIAFKVARNFIEDEISENELHFIIENSISFEAPIIKLSDDLSILELFHGPTLAFKDFGARFMARTMEYFLKGLNKEITILVATSGDTGSAVANGFLNVEGIKVLVLFPSGKISKIQEKQITTLGNNITAVEVEGTFDDCQRLVKTAFVDENLKSKINLSSANSINIGRLIPQSFYYFESYKQIENKDQKIVYSVPSGNLGNLTAGLFAKEMGLQINKFIAASNKNDVFTKFIGEGKFLPKASVETLSNAMDVGDPSNFARIIDLYKNDHKVISDLIFSKSFSDEETLNKIQYLYDNFKYVIDPHGAVGCLAFDQYKNTINENVSGVVLETAHPAKFINVIEDNLNIIPEIPDRLKSCLNKIGNTIKISNQYKDLKEILQN